jgi:hypothetical protein
MQKSRMNNLSKTLAKLFKTAAKLPPGEERQAALKEIRQFQTRLMALRSTLGPALKKTA